MRLKSFALVIAGLIIVVWAVSRLTTDIIPALQPTPTPVEEVLESFAPLTGPLSNPALNARTAPSGETESMPVVSRAYAAPPAAIQPTVIPGLTPSSAADATSQPAGPTETPPPDLAAIPTEDTAASGNDFLGAVEPAVEEARPTSAPEAKIAIPERIVIPRIELDAPVELSASQKIRIAGKVYYQWLAPDRFAAGWQTNSAYPGEKGNTVLNGHHNISGKVFAHLVDLNIGDSIDLYAGETVYHYIIVNKLILPERDVPVEQRLENARWLARSEDERLTLITCWPATSNTHRLIIVAIPDPAQK